MYAKSDYTGDRHVKYYLYVLLFDNGKRYFGISQNPDSRLRSHEKCAARGSKLPVHLAMLKYQYTQMVLLIGKRDYVAAAEISMIAVCRAMDRKFGYNISPGGDLSPMRSDEVRRRVSATKKIKCSTPEFRAMMSVQGRGRKASPETIIKLRNSHLGQKVSEERRLKMIGVPARNKGVPATPESREKNRASTLKRWEAIRASGVDTSLSTEHRAKISFTLMGHPGFGKSIPRTDEVRAKISAKKMGHVVSEETRAKISAKLKGRLCRPVVPEVAA